MIGPLIQSPKGCQESETRFLATGGSVPSASLPGTRISIGHWSIAVPRCIHICTSDRGSGTGRVTLEARLEASVYYPTSRTLLFSDSSSHNVFPNAVQSATWRIYACKRYIIAT